MKKFLLVATLLLAQGGQANAATVGFDPATLDVTLNDIFTVDIVGNDFPETQGGGLNLFFDQAVVNVLSISIENSVWNFVNSEGVTDNSTGMVSDILVSTFPGVQTSFTIATIELQAIGIGTSSLALTDSTFDNPWGSNGTPIDPRYVDGAVTVSAIPLPAAAWLFGTALIGLVRSGRRRNII